MNAALKALRHPKAERYAPKGRGVRHPKGERYAPKGVAMRGGILLTSAAKAVGGVEGVNAALKALRHPKALLG